MGVFYAGRTVRASDHSRSFDQYKTALRDCATTAADAQSASDVPSHTMQSDPTNIAASSAWTCGRRMCQTTSPATTATSASLT
jgi:hypothetical protein